MGFWSKAVGAVKDAASVGFAHLRLRSTTTSINARLADIDVALVKATRHNDLRPKEKHLLILMAATEEPGLRFYIKRAVKDRLSRTKNWMVAVKTLAVIHRLMMDVVPCIFAEEDQEMQHSSDTTPLVGVSQSFEDCSNPLALQFSLWVRKYSSFLAQSLRFNSTSNYVNLFENRNFQIAQLLEDFRSLHLLLSCLIDCIPPRQDDPVAVNSLIHYALDLLVKECPRIYAAINECIGRLLDYSFFDFPSDKALCFLNIYEQILHQYHKLSDIYDAWTRVGLTDDNGDYLSRKRLLDEMEDLIKLHRQHFIHLQEERITKKETTMKKETPRDEVEEVRPLITWWGSSDDEINFCSKTTQQDANYESNRTVKEWERALDMSVKASSNTAIYHAVEEWERALDMSVNASSNTAIYHAVEEWERALDMSVNASEWERALDMSVKASEWERALDMSIMDSLSICGWNGMDRSHSPNDGTQIELALMNAQRINPFLTVEMAHNEQQ